METNLQERRLMPVVIQFFKQDQWHFHAPADQSCVRAGYRGERGTWMCDALVDEAAGRFVFRALMGLNILPQHRPVVMEYLNRVNCALAVGSFELDLPSGEVRFRAGVDLAGSALTVAMVRAVANAAVQAMDHYFPGVLSIVHGGLGAEAALARVETQIAEL